MIGQHQSRVLGRLAADERDPGRRPAGPRGRDFDTASGDPGPRDLGREPGPGGGPQLSNVWVYKGRAYDLSEWINKHPGGEFFIGRSKNRDITSIIGSYHANPEKIEKMLERFALDRDARVEDVHPKNNAPAFLFKDGFDSWRDTPRYRFDDPKDLLHAVKARLRDPAMKARVKRMDRWFNIVAAALAVAYVVVIATRLGVPSWMPIWLFVLLMVILRSSLAGFGHYAIHRAQKGATKVLVNAFDINYVALSFVTADGHALLHHPHTQSEVDIKKNVFTMMMDIPRWYRIPIHTLHKFGHTATGMTMRLFEIVKLTRQVGVADMYGSLRGALPHHDLGRELLARRPHHFEDQTDQIVTVAACRPHQRHLELDGLAGEQFQVGSAGAERDDREPVGVVADDLTRLGADRTGGAEQGDGAW